MNILYAPEPHVGGLLQPDVIRSKARVPATDVRSLLPDWSALIQDQAVRLFDGLVSINNVPAVPCYTYPTMVAANPVNYKSSSWQVERSLGYGAFGAVWLVVDTETGFHAALKRISNIFQSIVSAKRAYRELSLLMNLNHSNIIKMLDVVKPTDYVSFTDVYILYEYMDTDLHKIIISSQPISVNHIKLFVYQILRGLKYLHSIDIAHRDIKPGNLLVSSNCLLKICDFGLARSLPCRSPAESSDLYHGSGTDLTLEVVTQFYRAPELLLCCSRYTSAVDIWSVGCILAELLTRRILFQSMNPFRQLEMILDLLGSPAPSDLADFASASSSVSLEFLSNRPIRPYNTAAMYTMLFPANRQGKSGSQLVSDCVDSDLLALFTGLLKFGPSSRLSADQALQSPFLATGRRLFHGSLCTCCRPVNGSVPSSPSWTVLSPPATPSAASCQKHWWLAQHRHPLAALNSTGTLASQSPGTPPTAVGPHATVLQLSAQSLSSPSDALVAMTLYQLINVAANGGGTGGGGAVVHFPLVPVASTAVALPLPFDPEPGGQGAFTTEVRMSTLAEAKGILWNTVHAYSAACQNPPVKSLTTLAYYPQSQLPPPPPPSYPKLSSLHPILFGHSLHLMPQFIGQ